jgi:hypothetical protein
MCFFLAIESAHAHFQIPEKVTYVLPAQNCSYIEADIVPNTQVVMWIWQGLEPIKYITPDNVKFAPGTKIRICSIDKYKIWVLYGRNDNWKLLYWRSVKNNTNATSVKFESGVLNQTIKTSEIDLLQIKDPTKLFACDEFIQDLFFKDDPIDNNRSFFINESQRINQMFPRTGRLTREYIDSCRNAGYSITVAPQGGLRTYEQQMDLYAKGRKKLANGTWTVVNKRAIVTKLKVSFHNSSLAIDRIFYSVDNENGSIHMYYPEPVSKKNNLWITTGKIALEYFDEWGANWTGWQDYPHTQIDLHKYVPKLMMPQTQFLNTLKLHYTKGKYTSENGQYWFLFQQMQEWYIQNNQ